MRNAFLLFFVLGSIVFFVLSVVLSILNLAPFGVPGGLCFAIGFVFMVLAIVFRQPRPRRERP